jgi:hypothetical protein
LTSGHYNTFRKTSSEWRKFDDSAVSVIAETEVVNQNAYILFYERENEDNFDGGDDIEELLKKEHEARISSILKV